jgi:UDPglucose 6-dehydrogenase
LEEGIMHISVIGLGYVGSVTAIALAKAGYDITGIDIDENIVSSFKKGNLPIYEPGLEKLLDEAIKEQKIRFATLEEVDEIGEIVFICVGTPSLQNGSVDLSYIRKSIKWVLERTSGPATIVVKSTVPPGTGKKLIRQYLSDTRLSYISNPEFLREGMAVEDWLHPDRIVIGGEDKESIERIKSLYSSIDAPVVITDITTAEMIKYAANSALAIKISFINEIANLCDILGADIDDVARGLSLDPRIGSGFLRAGLGYGGSCFPKDVRALDFLANSNGYSLELIRSAIIANNRQKFIPVKTLKRRFYDLWNVPVSILGLTFKPNTDDIREAPSIDIMNALLEEGADITAYDPKGIEKIRRIFGERIRYAKSPIEAINGTKAVILVTEWEEFVRLDWQEAFKRMQEPKIVIDGRNALDYKLLKSIGFEYYGIGRGRR